MVEKGTPWRFWEDNSRLTGVPKKCLWQKYGNSQWPHGCWRHLSLSDFLPVGLPAWPACHAEGKCGQSVAKYVNMWQHVSTCCQIWQRVLHDACDLTQWNRKTFVGRCYYWMLLLLLDASFIYVRPCADLRARGMSGVDRGQFLRMVVEGGDCPDSSDESQENTAPPPVLDIP